jgi:hypothetical protein
MRSGVVTFGPPLIGCVACGQGSIAIDIENSEHRAEQPNRKAKIRTLTNEGCSTRFVSTNHGSASRAVSRFRDFPVIDSSLRSPLMQSYNHDMRIFLAGASGVIGQRLTSLLVRAGHVVGGMTRSASNAELLRKLGAETIVCDVFDREALIKVARDFKPEVVLSELTDLPDDAAQISKFSNLNIRIRTEGNRNLIEAAQRSGSPKILAQSLAWQLPAAPDAQSVAELERDTLAAGGIVLRYGQFYGPGTYHEGTPPPEPRIQIDRAAEMTVKALDAPTGIVVIVDREF